MLVLAVVSSGIASLMVVATRAVSRTRAETAAVLAATERLEQLRGLAWGFGSAHDVQRGEDLATDLSTRETGPGGMGLRPSSPSALEEDVPGYVDYLDRDGRWVGNSGGAMRMARFVRRWSVQHIAGWPDTLILQVKVVDTTRTISDVRLYTIKTRTAG